MNGKAIIIVARACELSIRLQSCISVIGGVAEEGICTLRRDSTTEAACGRQLNS